MIPHATTRAVAMSQTTLTEWTMISLGMNACACGMGVAIRPIRWGFRKITHNKSAVVSMLTYEFPALTDSAKKIPMGNMVFGDPVSDKV